MDFIILKVNGQDLSQSSHNEAVEAFRSAKEPIVVEVLRRATKSSGGASSREAGPPGMKSRCPTMVSIGTQTEEDFYCYNRPPTPPPGFYPVPMVTGLYQPSSRRPVAFSPSAEVGLTDIEMGHSLDLEETYFDDRHYEIVYEEVLLKRTSTEEKLGLTLCYGSLEDELTDIFISEVDPCSVAGKDGRIREGDQIVQINGVEVRNRSEAISLFSSRGADISLTVARAQLQFDDGYTEEPNSVLDELNMDLLEKHHQDNMQFMASMLARHQYEEEGATTDTATTELQDKDSGVGRTDESTRNEESCEQETDSESLFMQQQLHNQSYCSLMSSDIPEDLCSRFHHMLDLQGGSNGSILEQDGRCKDLPTILDPELSVLKRDLGDIQVDYQELADAHLQEQQRLAFLGFKDFGQRTDGPRSIRVVPRMGTRLEYPKYPAESLLIRKPSPVGVATSGLTLGSSAENSRNNTNSASSKTGSANSVPIIPSSISSTLSSTRGVNSEFSTNTTTSSGSVTSVGVCDKEKDLWTTTSAYNTGESCRSTPLTLELNPASYGQEDRQGVSTSMLCLATPSSGSSGLVTSDTEKQTQTPTKPRDYSSEDSGHVHPRSSNSSNTIKAMTLTEGVKLGLVHPAQLGESLQDLYIRCSDVMYTNRANLQHTIAVQQKLFQQQMEQQARLRGHVSSPGHTKLVSGQEVAGEFTKNSPVQTAPSDSGQMEWVVKRRPDGTRYITRRPVRSKLLKERAKKISEERCGMTTDDDAMSEMKTGRYWSKEDRKRHLEKAKDYKRKKELLVKAKMETLKETEEKKEVTIVELSHRKMMKHKGKKVFDNFTTVKEMLAHGNKVGDGKPYNPLLSVTTV